MMRKGRNNLPAADKEGRVSAGTLIHYKVTVVFAVKFRLLLKQKQLKAGNAREPKQSSGAETEEFSEADVNKSISDPAVIFSMTNYAYTGRLNYITSK
jgi:hypothetical protein